MKKVIFTVSAIVCLALSAMFVSCNTAAENGCVCTYTILGGGSYTDAFDIAEMKEYFAVSSCGDLANAFTKWIELDYGEGKVAKMNCSGY